MSKPISIAKKFPGDNERVLIFDALHREWHVQAQTPSSAAPRGRSSGAPSKTCKRRAGLARDAIWLAWPDYRLSATHPSVVGQ
jgi:hypothetical protein